MEEFKSDFAEIVRAPTKPAFGIKWDNICNNYATNIKEKGQKFLQQLH